MNLCQLLTLEISPSCNYARQHSLCPTLSPERWAGKNTAKSLDEDLICKLIRRGYLEFGFRGAVAFHYYNEPMLSAEKMYRVIDRTHAEIPGAKFILWTNGSLIQPENVAEMKRFWAITISDYDKRDWSFLNSQVLPGVLEVHKVEFDNRLMPIASCDNMAHCVRPYTEFVVDYHGYVHLCCVDWRGLASPGNIFQEDLAVLVERFRDYRRRISRGQMTQDAPLGCRRCIQRYWEVDNFIPQLREAALEDMRK